MNLPFTGLEKLPDVTLIDGNRCKENFPTLYETIVKGERREYEHSSAASSILAKVSRDRYIVGLDGLYPE